MLHELESGWYQDLIKDIVQLEFAGIVTTKHAIGKRILADFDKFGNPKYGEQGIQQLAKAVGISAVEIYRCMNFAEQYPDKLENYHSVINLSWHRIVHELLPEPRKERDVTPLPDDKYNIIYADPPWFYPHSQEYYGQYVTRHYETIPTHDMKELPIRDLCGEDCVLYLWATAPLLDEAIEVLKAWGFEYKTCLVWDKVKHNMGFYSSVRHEFMLIGGIGQSAPTDKSYANQTDSVYVEERTEHSVKPEYYYEMIEKMHPEKTNRIELFARKKRDGWDSWGNEV